MNKLGIIVLLLLLHSISWAGNVVVEADLVADSLKGLRHGEIIHVQSGKENFVALLDKARSKTTEGGVILLPEAGHNAATQTVIGPLRVFLPNFGWTTLSLQLPVLEPEADPSEYWRLLPEARQRLAAAVNWWKQKGVNNIVLLGYGWGGLVASTYLADRADDAVQATVLVSMGWPDEYSQMMKQTLSKITVPVLDIWAGRDNAEVLDTRLDRYLIFKENKGYRQRVISAAGHDYQARQVFLAKRILGWLRRTAPGITLVNSD